MAFQKGVFFPFLAGQGPAISISSHLLPRSNRPPRHHPDAELALAEQDGQAVQPPSPATNATKRKGEPQ